MEIREVQVKYLRPGVHSDSRQFSNSRQVYEAFRDTLNCEPVEVFVVIYLNSKNRMLYFERISRGSLSTSVVHPREAFSNAVRFHAAAIIAVHNHPSGDPAPSREDRECTARLVHAGQILGIRVLDHLVCGFEDYYSFADAGLLSEPQQTPVV